MVNWSILTIITDVLFPRHTAGSNEDYFSFRVMASRLLHLIGVDNPVVDAQKPDFQLYHRVIWRRSNRPH